MSVAFLSRHDFVGVLNSGYFVHKQFRFDARVDQVDAGSITPAHTSSTRYPAGAAVVVFSAACETGNLACASREGRNIKIPARPMAMITTAAR